MRSQVGARRSTTVALGCGPLAGILWSRAVAAHIRVTCVTCAVLLGSVLMAYGQEAEWTVVQDGPIGDGREDYYRMSFVDANNGWILGGFVGTGVADSFIGIKTSDGGRTWSDIHIPTFRVRFIDGEPLVWDGKEMTQAGARGYAVHLISPTEAWVGGAERLGHTTDGGETWEVLHLGQVLPDIPDVRRVADLGRLNVYGVHFWNSTEGVISCVAQLRGEDAIKAGMALATHDGGQTWELRGASVVGVRLDMRSRTEGWMTRAGGLSGLNYTADGWRTSRRVIEGSVHDAYFAGDGRAWALASPERTVEPVTILRSLDNGETWVVADIDSAVREGLSRRLGVIAMAFDPTSRGWVGATEGVILTTADGVTWTGERSPFERELTDIQYVGGVVYAVARDGMVARRESGATGVEVENAVITTWGRVKTRHAEGGTD